MKSSTSSHPPPPVDDHFVREGARVEVVDGQAVMAPPSEEPHANSHFALSYVLGAHVATGFRGAVDMLTRTGDKSDFAPDASIYPAERDPDTGRRELEELAFEVAATQSLEGAASKARELARRGVRRVFCIVIQKHRRVLEWSRETDAWSPLHDAAAIDDRCLVRPLPVRALLDATATDEAVIRALIARGHPTLDELQQTAEARGVLRGKLEALLELLAARALHPKRDELARLEAADGPTLTRWTLRLATTPSVAALLADTD